MPIKAIVVPKTGVLQTEISLNYRVDRHRVSLKGTSDWHLRGDKTLNGGLLVLFGEVKALNRNCAACKAWVNINGLGLGRIIDLLSGRCGRQEHLRIELSYEIREFWLACLSIFANAGH